MNKKKLWITVGSIFVVLVLVVILLITKPWAKKGESPDSSDIIYIGEDNVVEDSWGDSEWLS